TRRFVLRARRRRLAALWWAGPGLGRAVGLGGAGGLRRAGGRRGALRTARSAGRRVVRPGGGRLLRTRAGCPASAGGGGITRSRGCRLGGIPGTVRAAASRVDSPLVPDHGPLGLRASIRGFRHFLSSSSTISASTTSSEPAPEPWAPPPASPPVAPKVAPSGPLPPAAAPVCAYSLVLASCMALFRLSWADLIAAVSEPPSAARRLPSASLTVVRESSGSLSPLS